MTEPSQRTPVRRRLVVAGAAALLVVGSAVPAKADPAATPPKDPTPTKSGQGVPEGTDVYELYKAALGTQGMKNQEDLNDFKTWLITRPGVVADGFYESGVNINDRSMTLQWHGNSPQQSKAVTEGARRGLKIIIKHVSYTRASVDRATALLLDPRNAARLGGFRVTSVAGPTVENDKLTVAGTVPGKAATTAADVGSRASAMAPAVKALTGLDADFTPGRASIPYTTRSTDTGAKNAGGMIRGSQGNGCTSGFGIKRSNLTWTTTARHCDDDSWRAWDLNTSASQYGSRYDADAGTGNRLLTGDGFYWMFDGAWNNSSGYHKTVNGLADVSQGTSVCSSGANSGVHCGLVVDNMRESFNDGYGSFSSIRVHAQSGIAGAHGDSGGPILIPVSGGTYVKAVGMLQGSQETQTSNCGSLRIATQCSAYIEFTSERVFLSNMGATLYTG
ncbi:S1 family peptidase [Couchioplanes caeruleus]|uniref:S1 family peptidase n=1 Tax=Couchioplanes caeruleus TaxID=56438 RepID=UPI0020BE60BD|nr:S1 family peptidase [Couchioplanes caeruleus]UQU63775.1 S1 family peptidase [Couchioplanes caeruleus]